MTLTVDNGLSSLLFQHEPQMPTQRFLPAVSMDRRPLVFGVRKRRGGVLWRQSGSYSTTYEIPIREIIAAVARNARWSMHASIGRQNQVAEAGKSFNQRPSATRA